MKVREWQIQGGREYMEDVLHIEYNLKNSLGDLFVGMFDGHGGKGCAEWLGNNLQAIIEKKYLKQPVKDMKLCLEDSFLKAHKKALSEKSVGDSGSTAAVKDFFKCLCLTANDRVFD